MWKPRLRRLDTVYRVPAVYFLTTGTESRRPVLADAGVHEALIGYARSASQHRVTRRALRLDA